MFLMRYRRLPRSAQCLLGSLLLVSAGCLVGCASLPDAQFVGERYAVQAARFEGVRGPLSARQSAALLARLKRGAGALDLLDRQIALEQEIGGSPLVLGNAVALLQDGPATYAAMFAAIAAARDHINIESYIVDDSAVGERFAAALLGKQAAGVQVNLIYDSVGALATGPAYFERLRAGGVAVVEFNPLNPLVAKAGWSPNHRDHRKLMVVDGRIAFLGGINISSVYASGSSPRRESRAAPADGGWRDTDVRIEGPVVAEFQKLFLQTFAAQHGGAAVARDYFPAPLARGGEIVRAIGSTPDDPYSLIYLTLLSAITNAEKRVHITQAYFVPDPQLVQALLAAAARGVEVQLILPERSDSNAALYAGRSHFSQLLEGGVRIHERHGAMLHVKSAVIDGVWSCVGSSNLDWRSALDNEEINAVILGAGFAAQMESAFAADLAAADEITPARWAARPLLQRFKEWTARLFGRLL